MSEKFIDIFPWNEHFFTGISLIDEQHQKLVNILNRLANHIAFESSECELSTLFDELGDYIVYHFDAEEKIWNDYLAHDELLLNHKDGHQTFIDQLAHLRQQVEVKPKHQILGSTLEFLTRWLVSHILETDMYMAFVVQFIETGSTIEQAKIAARDKITKSSKGMIDFILSIYQTLSSNTFHLVQKIHEYEVLLESLKQYQARISEMQAYAQLGYWDLDQSNNSAHWSEHIYQMFGLDSNIPAGPTTLQTIVHPDDFEIFSNSIQLCITDGLEHHASYRIKRPNDGQTRWMDCHGQLVKDAKGKPIKISGYIQDITLAKQQQQLLAEKDELLSFITNNLPLYIAIAYGDKNDHYKFVNKQYADLYGYHPSEMIGLHVSDVLGENIYTAAKEAIEQAKSGKAASYIRHRDDAPHDLLVSYASAFDKNNKLIGTIAALLDVSERFETERFERFYTSILELLTAERSLDMMLYEIVKGIEALYPDILCSINLLDKTGRYFEKVVAPSLPEFYNQAVKGIELANGVGCCGTSVATGEVAITEDIMTHPDWSQCKDLAQSANLGACWSQPIISGADHILGTLAIYRREKYSPSDNDLLRIARCAHLASIAITDYLHRQQLEIAATVFESEKEGMMITDADNIIIQVNKAFRDITGYSDQDVLGQSPKKLSSGLHDAEFYKVMWQSINETGGWAGEIYDRRKNGEIFPEFLRISAVYDSDHKHVVNYVATFSDMTSDKKAEESIERLAFYDSLTGLPNRRLTHDRIQRAIAASSRNNSYGFLLLLDIDRFKLINDIHGHDFGDAFLCQVVSRLQFCLREQDTLSRMGGDEFAIIIEQLSENKVKAIEQVNTVVEKVLTTINQDFNIEGISYSCTLSVGVTMFIDHKVELSELLKQVDIALVHAKNMGGNCYSYFDPKMQELLTHRIMLETELSNAIKSEQLELYLQSQVDQTGKIVGAEALIRWNHPKHGIISPADFIPLAEETGLIIPLGAWVLNEGCKQLKHLQHNQDTKSLTIAVNVSAKQFYQDDFIAVVKSAIEQNNINPRQLKLELTESVLVSDVEKTVAVMNELASLGIKFSMDDFGTGYSSLQYLSRLPLHQLKIDQSFISGINADTSGIVIVRTIIAMAKNLGLDVIAEGVETPEQLAALSAEQCAYFQGYLFSKPVTFHHFLELLADSTIEV